MIKMFVLNVRQILDVITNKYIIIMYWIFESSIYYIWMIFKIINVDRLILITKNVKPSQPSSNSIIVDQITQKLFVWIVILIRRYF